MKLRQKHKLFMNPTPEYRGKPFWSWNGKMEKEELLRQIDVMKQMGFGGYFMHSRTGLETEYLGEEWFHLTNACADYGSHLMMESWIYDEDRWPSGSAGGLVTKEEKYRAMFLEMQLLDSGELSSFEWGSHVCIAFACVVDGKHYYNSRKLTRGTELEPGETAVIFLIRYSACKDVYNGYTYLNTMSKESVDKYIKITHKRYKDKCGGRIGSTIKGIFTDEPHRGAVFSEFAEGKENLVPYTPGIFGEFKKRFGYDLTDNLLNLFLRAGNDEISKAARDYLELCQELFIESYAIPIRDWCHQHNMLFTGHVLQEDSLTAQSVMQGSLMRFYEYMDYPGIDLLTEHARCYWIAKQVESVARQLKKEKVLSELYGCTGWQMDFETYKHVGDWQTLFGINLRCPHLSWYTMKGEAKRDYPASILHQSAWYEEYRYLENYYSRIHAIFNGKPQCELLVLNPIESVWARAYSGAFSGLSANDVKIRRLEEIYEATFHILTGRGIDFDYGEEDIMSRHARVEGRLFHVGEMSYQRILVVGMEVMRDSTYQLLAEFVQQGGEVIFAGNVPEYVDTLPSMKVVDLAGQARRIPFSTDEIVDACRSGNEIEVLNIGNNDILSQVRTNDLGRVIMLLNVNRTEGFDDVEICLGKGHYGELWDAKTGTVYNQPAVSRNGQLYIKTSFARGEEKLYVVTDKKRKLAAIPDVLWGAAIPGKIIDDLPTSYEYRMSEKNICVLDIVKVKTNLEEEVAECEVLKADQRLRDLIPVPHRSGDMVQPWYDVKYNNAKSELLRTITLEYQVMIETLPETVELAIEDLAHVSALNINGKAVKLAAEGKWLDICFDKIAIPKDCLVAGNNVILIECLYYKTSGIEAIYLIGDFGVHLTADGCKPVLTQLPARLHVGNICSQGFPFYSGKVSYIMNLDRYQELWLENIDYYGACAKLIGRSEEIIAHPPYRRLIAGFNELQVILTRRNTFGPLHQLPAKAWAYGADNFTTEDDEWQDAYVLYDQGLMKNPVLYETAHSPFPK